MVSGDSAAKARSKPFTLLLPVTAGCTCERQHADSIPAAQQAQSGGQDATHAAEQASEVGFQIDSLFATAMQHVHR